MIPEEIRALNGSSEGNADKEDLIRCGVKSAQQRRGNTETSCDDPIEDIAEESGAEQTKRQSGVVSELHPAQRQQQESEQESGTDQQERDVAHEGGVF